MGHIFPFVPACVAMKEKDQIGDERSSQLFVEQFRKAEVYFPIVHKIEMLKESTKCNEIKKGESPCHSVISKNLTELSASKLNLKLLGTRLSYYF